MTIERQLVSRGLGGQEANGDSKIQDVSADGRYILFSSTASNLVAGDTNGVADLFRFDRESGTTSIISGIGADIPYGFLGGAEITSDGQGVVYGGYELSSAGSGQGAPVVIRANLSPESGVWYTQIMSTSVAPIDANVGFSPSMSADGATIAFLGRSTASDSSQPYVYVPVGWTPQEIGRTALAMDIDVIDIAKGQPDVSDNGRYIAFGVGANLLGELPSGLGGAPSEPNAEVGTFVHDFQTGRTAFVAQLTTLASGGYPDVGPTHPALSADGREVAFGNGYLGRFKAYASTNGGMSVVDRVTGKELADVNEGTSYNPANSIQITDDGSIAGYAYNSYANSAYSGIIVAEVGSGIILTNIIAPLNVDMVLIPNGSGIAFSGQDGSYYERSHVYYLPINQAPVAKDDSVTLPKSAGSTRIEVLANDSDKDQSKGDTFKILAAEPIDLKGKLNVYDDHIQYDPNGAFADLQPGQKAVEVIPYTIVDELGARASATLTITIDGGKANSAPQAVADSVTIEKSAAATVIDVLANDKDKDAGDGKTITAVDTSGILGKVSFTGSAITYDPDHAFDSLVASGKAVERFSYTMQDSAGASSSATVTVTITGSGSGPSRQLDGTDVANKLNGTKQDDIIDGKGGNDVLNGKAGNDVLTGGAGDDTVTGGKGADRFVAGTGRDLIKDFKAGDVLDLSDVLQGHTLPTGWSDGLQAGDAGVSLVKKALVIDWGSAIGGSAGADVLTLKGVGELNLSSLLTS